MILKNFLPPFIVAFGIALFVLTMQILWVYVDDIMGKGVSIWMLIEFIFYLSISLVPMAMSIAMLLASVMSMGALAEKYELSAMKSAGISLERIMRPLIILAIGMAGLSFIFSNYLSPFSNLKFKSRLHDIRTQKPALSLEESVFNYDFKGFVIRIGEKAEDKVHLKDVLIINHGAGTGESSEIIAKKGQMYTTDDQRYFVMKLEDGWRYAEPSKYKNPKKKYPLVRTKFSSWRKIFDLSEFQIDPTDEDRFKSHQSMLNVGQLLVAIDSLKAKKARKLHSLKSISKDYYNYALTQAIKNKQSETTKKLLDKRRKQQGLKETKVLNQLAYNSDTIQYFAQTFPKLKRNSVLAKAKSSLARLESSAARAVSSQEGIDKKLRLFWFELLSKFNLAFACIVFLFIGAPMGAIIRKGGFGYPLLVAIAFFIVFIMFTMVGKKMVTEGELNVWVAAFLGSMILLPVGFYLTRQAMRDSKLFQF